MTAVNLTIIMKLKRFGLFGKLDSLIEDWVFY